MDETDAITPSALTDSRLATLCAEAARDAFVAYENQFDEITRRASARFRSREWGGSFDDARERLRLYSSVVDRATMGVRRLMGSRLDDRSIWIATKAVYSALIARSDRWEIAESFFNSLTRRVFTTEGVNQAIEFVDTDFDAPPSEQVEIARLYRGAPLPELITRLLTDETASGLALPCWTNLHESVQKAAGRLREAAPRVEAFEIIRSMFYRGRGAYLVGRALGGDVAIPVAFCLLHPSGEGVTLDALLLGEGDLAILFSYTRAPFHVDAPCPFRIVRWLRELMPTKRLADLYNAIGYNRHAKTEFYRDFKRHLDGSSDVFVEARGTRGMVMLVFTLPSYEVVFKIIRDRFDAPKENDRSDVMSRYKLVFEHDRVGRLVEAYEFEHFRIPRVRFGETLLREITENAASTVRFEGDDVIIAHCYIERRVRPLNLFFAEADSASNISAACDYGQAIKDLAASNIFPGDLLTKNFGLTRRNRVVFYDYDELCFLTDCNFRELPESRTYEEELSAEPWFSVRENDIFPEEFPRFLAFPKEAREKLMERHGDLFRPEFWREMQEKHRAGDWPDIFPYGEDRRLRSR